MYQEYVVALALTGEQALRVLRDPGLVALLDELPVACAVVGADRIDGGPAARRTLDPSTAVAVLAGRTRSAAFLLAASPVRDHPYNLARRVASAAHLSHGRTGLAVGADDPYVAVGAGRSAGGGPVLTAAAGPEAARDLVLAVQRLEQTWPWEAVVADRERGIFARGDAIRVAQHEGVFSVAGPLTLPATAEGSSVVAWWAASRAELAPAAEVADLVVVAPADLAAAREARAAAPRGHFADPAAEPLLLTTAAMAPGAPVAELVAEAAGRGADGVVLRPLAPDPRAALEALAAAGGRVPAGTLRSRLGLPRTASLLEGRPAAFPEPAPL